MELAVSVETTQFDQGARRTSTWSHKVASMSRRLESRWAAAAPQTATPDPAAHEQLVAFCTARAEHEAARSELASAD